MGFTKRQTDAIKKFQKENGTEASKEQVKIIPKVPKLSSEAQAKLAKKAKELEACLKK